MKRRAFLAAAAALAARFRVLVEDGGLIIYKTRSLGPTICLAQHALREAYDRFRVVWAHTTINVSEDGGSTWTAVPARDFQARYGFPPDPQWLGEFPPAKIVFGFKKEPTT